MPGMPEGNQEELIEGILKGIYKFSSTESGEGQKMRPQLFGSGTIFREALRAQSILKDKYGIGSDLHSVTSYSELARDAMAATRWNTLHPEEAPKKSYLETKFDGVSGPFISTSDNVRLVADQVRQWIPGRYVVLGTDGFGRSEERATLRRHFEIDAECTVYATLHALSQEGLFDKNKLPQVIKDLGIDAEKVDPRTA